jgi:hypothetical protein
MRDLIDRSYFQGMVNPQVNLFSDDLKSDERKQSGNSQNSLGQLNIT